MISLLPLVSWSWSLTVLREVEVDEESEVAGEQYETEHCNPEITRTVSNVREVREVMVSYTLITLTKIPPSSFIYRQRKYCK
jgi:hypothetical protein